MNYRKALLYSIITLTLVLTACTSAGPESTMTDEPAGSMTEAPVQTEMMHDSPTASSMAGKPTQEMMATSTGEMMTEDMATPESMMESPTPDSMMHETPTPDAMMTHSSEDSMMESPAWFEASLRNVADGSTFSINDSRGKVILVETMAIWCPSCKSQQAQIKALHTQLGMPSDLVSISLDIDPNESEDMLKDYIANNGFDWIYAIAPADVAREIGNLYGAQLLNPPSTPILIIDREGEVHLLPFGIKSADDLQQAIEPYLNGM